MREAHQACIPPCCAEGNVEIARYEYGITGTLEDHWNSRRSLLYSMYPVLREGADCSY